MAYQSKNPNGQATMANSEPVVIASNQTTVPTKLATDVAIVNGTITTSTGTVTLTNLNGVGSATVTISGIYAGVNVTFEASIDGTSWYVIPAQQGSSVTPSVLTATGVLVTNSSNSWNVSPLLGWQQFRVRATAYTSGTANVAIEPSAQFVQPIVNVATMPTTTVTGTVTSNLGTAGTAATSLGKARDGVAGGTDTNVGIMAVRRDTPTAVTPAAGDYELPQIDARGSQWVREATASTANKTSVAASATSVEILAANAARKTAILVNESTSDAYISYGGTASTTSYTVPWVAGATVTVPGSEWAGSIVAIWNSATGNARVTETLN